MMDPLEMAPAAWGRRPLWSMFHRRKDLGHPDEPLLSVFREHGVVARGEHVNHNQAAENRNIYQLVDNGWFVVNRMKAWQGSVGISFMRGIVSGHYICFEPTHRESPRYLNWLLRSDPYTRLFETISRGVRPGQAEIDNDDLDQVKVLLPPLDDQRRIADFLDDQVARIDNIVAAREKQMAALEALRLNVSITALSGSTGSGDRKDSGLPWLGSIPMAWPMSTVQSAFEVVLGKMLDESRFSGEYAIPYLRNTNVQWDHIQVDDLKVMDIPPSEYDRFTVRSGDLLICEGGQPGRSAVWKGDITPLGFQKALHRARPRGDCDVRWLQVFLRVAVGLSVFASEFGQSTISHLTGEQLRSARIPIPPAAVQVSLCNQVEDGSALIDAAQLDLRRSIDLQVELKRSLITSAVTGKFDVSSSDGSRVPV